MTEYRTGPPARAVVERVLHELRPEIDPAPLPGSAELREEFDLDSMDFLNFVIGIHEATGVEIPEADYGELFTLDDCVQYLERHRAAS